MSDGDRAQRGQENRKRLLERLNSYGEGAAHDPEGEEREPERLREIEKSRRPEPGTGGGFGGGT
jgi:hypothetical protein